jgi:hypothetical protein
VNNKRTAIAMLISGAFALILAVALGNGAFDSYLREDHSYPVADIPVQPVDPAVNVESLDEMVIVGDNTPVIAVEDLPLERTRTSTKVSGPGAARFRPATTETTPLKVPEGAEIASSEALSYDPIRSHGVRSVHLRRNPSTIGQPHRSMEREHETFVFQER